MLYIGDKGCSSLTRRWPNRSWGPFGLESAIIWYPIRHECQTAQPKGQGRFGLVSLFNGISSIFRLFNAIAILLKEQFYLTHSWEDKGVHTFPKGICLKVNIIVRLENELAYYDSAVHHFNHYTPRRPGKYICNLHLLKIVLYYLPTPPLGKDMTQGQFLSGV